MSGCLAVVKKNWGFTELCELMFDLNKRVGQENKKFPLRKNISISISSVLHNTGKIMFWK